MEDFIKLLMTETEMDYNESYSLLITIKYRGGNLKTAKSMYKSDGLYGLKVYENQLKYGIVY